MTFMLSLSVPFEPKPLTLALTLTLALPLTLSHRKVSYTTRMRRSVPKSLKMLGLG